MHKVGKHSLKDVRQNTPLIAQTGRTAIATTTEDASGVNATSR